MQACSACIWVFKVEHGRDWTSALFNGGELLKFRGRAGVEFCVHRDSGVIKIEKIQKQGALRERSATVGGFRGVTGALASMSKLGGRLPDLVKGAKLDW